MMKRIYPFLFVIITFYILSCTEKSKDFFVQVSLSNNVYKTAYIYGFWGDNQILVDSIPVKNSIFTYDISKTCNVGVYRIQFSSTHFIDFIYNNENVVISADAKDLNKSIAINESNENKLLYSYFNAIQKLQDNIEGNQKRITLLDSNIKNKYIDSINNYNRKEYSKIYNDIYGLDKNKKLFAYSIIQLLDMPKYEFYTVNNPNINLSRTEFLIQNCFTNQIFNDERLIATPYFYSSLRGYLDEFTLADSSNMNIAIEKLYTKSIANQYFSSFVSNFLYEYLYSKNYDASLDFYMNTVSQGTIHKIEMSDTHHKSSLIHLNEQIPKVFEKYYKKSSQTIMLFCDTSSSNKILLKEISKKQGELFAKSINVCIFEPSKKQIWLESCSSLNILYAPVVVLIDSNGKVINRIFGKNAVLGVLSKL